MKSNRGTLPPCTGNSHTAKAYLSKSGVVYWLSLANREAVAYQQAEQLRQKKTKEGLQEPVDKAHIFQCRLDKFATLLGHPKQDIQEQFWTTWFAGDGL